MMPGQLLVAGGKAVAAHDRGQPAKAITSATRAQHRRPLAEHRPGDQRGPDRHGVGDQRRFARRQPQQRQPHQHHPAGDVEQRRDQQPRPDLARPTFRLSPADQRERGQQHRPEHAGHPAQRQRRQLGEEELGHRPVEAPAHRGDGEEHQAGRGDARPRVPVESDHACGVPGRNRRSAWPGSGRPPPPRRACLPSPSVALRESR